MGGEARMHAAEDVELRWPAACLSSESGRELEDACSPCEEGFSPANILGGRGNLARELKIADKTRDDTLRVFPSIYVHFRAFRGRSAG